MVMRGQSWGHDVYMHDRHTALQLGVVMSIQPEWLPSSAVGLTYLGRALHSRSGRAKG